MPTAARLAQIAQAIEPCASATKINAAAETTPVARRAQQSHPFGIADALALRNIDAVALSPHGNWVAYTVSDRDHHEDRRVSSLWMVSTDRGAVPIRMSAPGLGASSPAWSPDGTMLCFLAARSIPAAISGCSTAIESTQVWGSNMAGGDAQPLTFVKQGVESFRWSPDGGRLLLTVRDEVEASCDADAPRNRPKPWVIDRLQTKQDYTGYLHNRIGRTHLHVQDMASGCVKQITGGSCDENGAEWSPCATRIAFVSNRSPDPDATFSSNVYVVSATNSDKGRTLLQITDHAGCSVRGLAWAPDGQTLAYTFSPKKPEVFWYATTHVALAASDGTDCRLTSCAKRGADRVLTWELDRNVSRIRFSPDGESIFATVEDSGALQLCSISLGPVSIPTGSGTRRSSNDGVAAVEILIGGEVAVESYDVSSGSATTVVALVSSPHLPAEVFLLESLGEFSARELRQLTFINDDVLSSVTLGAVHKVAIPCADVRDYTTLGNRRLHIDRVNQTVEMFVVLPPGVVLSQPGTHQDGQRFPTILWCHGGPVAQFDYGFAANAQLFASAGYVVLLVNPRGSTGRGEEFCAALYADWGGPATHDVLTAVDYAVDSLGLCDPRRLGVGGWSYGGILTNYVITTDNRFKAAISGASQFLFTAAYGHDQYQLYWEMEFGLPWENPQGWDAISPFNRVRRATPQCIRGRKQARVSVRCGEVSVCVRACWFGGGDGGITLVHWQSCAWLTCTRATRRRSSTAQHRP